MPIYEINGHKVLEVDPFGPPLGSEADARDILGEAFGADATVIVIPLQRLDPQFLVLGSRLAGEFYQKMQNYGRRLVVLGDISQHTSMSRALHDFVYETNKVGNHLFVPDRTALSAALS
jgi:hypothetical protein